MLIAEPFTVTERISGDPRARSRDRSAWRRLRRSSSPLFLSTFSLSSSCLLLLLPPPPPLFSPLLLRAKRSLSPRDLSRSAASGRADPAPAGCTPPSSGQAPMGAIWRASSSCTTSRPPRGPRRRAAGGSSPGNARTPPRGRAPAPPRRRARPPPRPPRA